MFFVHLFLKSKAVCKFVSNSDVCYTEKNIKVLR